MPMGQIFLARHLLQKATVTSPLGGRLRPCTGFRVNPAVTTSSAALAHNSRHCSHSAHSHLWGCCGTQGRNGGNETGASTELLATPQVGNPRLCSVLKIFLNCLFQSRFVWLCLLLPRTSGNTPSHWEDAVLKILQVLPTL